MFRYIHIKVRKYDYYYTQFYFLFFGQKVVFLADVNMVYTGS